MSKLDLGFSSFEYAQKVMDTQCERSLNHIWMCDWEIVSFLDKINLVYDATMYRMYCSEYDIACDYTDEECLELAQKYKKQIYQFQIGLLKNIVVAVYDRWVSYVKADKVLVRLPGPAKTALLNFVSIVKRMAESEYAPHFLGMFSSLAEAHKSANTHTFDISDVQETISKEQFESYCEIVKFLLVRPFTIKDDDSDIKLFNTRIIFAQKVLMSILWMCETDHVNREYSPDIVFDRWILPYMKEVQSFVPYINKCMSRKGAPTAYAICVTPETIDLIQEDNDSYPITDTFRLMLTMLFVNTVDTNLITTC